MDSSVAGYCVGRTEGVAFVDGCFFSGLGGDSDERGLLQK